MGESEESQSERMQGLTVVDHRNKHSINVNVNVPQLNPNQFRSRNNCTQRPPIPPPLSRPPHQSFSPIPSPVHHSRSLSQPAFFSLDSLPPLSPSPNSAGDVSMEDSPLPPRSLPPRHSHRRSSSDIPFGFSSFGRAPAVKKESSEEDERKSEGEVVITDDLFSAYMNLEGIEALNSSGENNHGDSSDNEAESSVNSMKRRAVAGGDIAHPNARHFRSVSMDSFIRRFSFGDESPKVPLSPGNQSRRSPSDSIDGSFSLEFGNGEFNSAELKKIIANDKLAEIALTDPKRVKRILANRQSAARSKERKMRYISELEHKVQTLQTEATTLSAQVTLLQRDSVGLTNQNSELKFRIQAMEQQAQLRDALNEALTAEVQRLKIATAEMNGGDSMALKGMSMFPYHQQQQSQYRQQNGASKPESNQ